MTELKAAKGPYKVYTRHAWNDVAGVAIEDERGGLIAQAITTDDAHLLAAAWEMYAELQRQRKSYEMLLEWCGPGDSTVLYRTQIDRIGTTLAKARGEKP